MKDGYRMLLGCDVFVSLRFRSEGEVFIIDTRREGRALTLTRPKHTVLNSQCPRDLFTRPNHYVYDICTVCLMRYFQFYDSVCIIRTARCCYRHVPSNVFMA